MDRPTWERREAWGLFEATSALVRGVLPSPTVVLFEGDEATVYIRSGPKLGAQLDQRLAWNELFALGWVLHPEAVLVVMPVRVRTDEDGALAGEAEGQAAIGMEWMRRRPDGAPEHGGVVHTYGLDDRGEVAFRDREELPDDDGPLHAALTAIVTGAWPETSGGRRTADLGMPPQELAYSLRCSGLTIGVAAGWFARYGFDGPLEPRLVRREDRGRARAWQARRRELSEVRP